MTVEKLKELCEKAITDGYEDATVIVQADADGISDIVVNGFEGYYNFGGYYNEVGKGPKVFSLVSSRNKKQFENCYGPCDDSEGYFKKK